ncbi:hypothetical protein GDO78_011801 [Eleutherodactylus coqui]|uniref:Uncharacterized protein n=1 Tax=Eleutherodactylus coqui TaxID=57060 RepID=A0A8J6F3Q7_ELECQ|nr:hypothetical protein GDO78_011801 [Eleutherodactylus coqui]
MVICRSDQEHFQTCVFTGISAKKYNWQPAGGGVAINVQRQILSDWQGCPSSQPICPQIVQLNSMSEPSTEIEDTGEMRMSTKVHVVMSCLLVTDAVML